jgi:AcrR family transcriptional regulator
VTRSSRVARRAEDTRAALVAGARHLFVEKGYFAAGTEEIVARAGVGTRGALYHHFADKRALFEAVFEAVEEDLLAAAADTPTTVGAFERLQAGLLGFLDAASSSPEVQQVILIDGPAVLGWQRWRALEARYGLRAMQRLLEEAVAEGTIAAQPLDVLAHVLLAAVDEAALFIANAPDPRAARDEAIGTIARFFPGIAT